jgi:hypothetical protein
MHVSFGVDIMTFAIQEVISMQLHDGAIFFDAAPSASSIIPAIQSILTSYTRVDIFSFLVDHVVSYRSSLASQSSGCSYKALFCCPIHEYIRSESVGRV